MVTDPSKLRGHTDNVTVGQKLETGSGEKWVGSEGEAPILPNVCGKPMVEKTGRDLQGNFFLMETYVILVATINRKTSEISPGTLTAVYRGRQ